MKKFTFAAFTLMVLAGSTFTIPAVNANAQAATTKTTVKPERIPPPTCAYDDPNGCGIYG